MKFRAVLALVALVCLFLSYASGSNVSAQEFNLWGNLEAGNFAIGFKTIEKYDKSRAYGNATDYFGNQVEGEIARPIQVCYWYPAAESDGPAMVYGEYSFPYPADESFMQHLDRLQNREFNALGAVFMGRGPILDYMNLELKAVRDAQMAEGQFPLIIYHAGYNGSYAQNVVMCEYLASHGFIVATTHNFGFASIEPVREQYELETAVQDKEFVLGVMTNITGVDISKTGVLGYEFGGASAIIHGMRDSRISAVAALGPMYLIPEGAQATIENPFFNPMNSAATTLVIYSDDAGTADFSVLDSLKYTDQYRVNLKQYDYSSFAQFALASAYLGGEGRPSHDDAYTSYALLCDYMLNFYKGTLGSSESALAEVAKELPVETGIVTFTKGNPVPPTPAQFGQILMERSVSEALALAEQFSLVDPSNPIMPERNLLGLGYRQLGQGQTENALGIFKLMTECYPNSSNAWDSFAEATRASGNLEKAIELYEKSLALIDGDNSVSQEFKDRMKAATPETIAEIKQEIADGAGN